MLAAGTHNPYIVDEPDLSSDRSMLVLQYLTAAIAMAAAVPLGFVR